MVIQKILSLLPLGYLEHYTGCFGATVWLQRVSTGSSTDVRLLNLGSDVESRLTP